MHQHSRQAIDTRPGIGEPFGPPERTEIRWTRTMTRTEVIDMVASRSYVIILPDAERRRLLYDVDEFLRNHPDLRGTDEITMPYVTHCTRAQRG